MFSGGSTLREHPRTPAPGSGTARPGLMSSGGSTRCEHAHSGCISLPGCQRNR